jgi:hypothetical protein
MHIGNLISASDRFDSPRFSDMATITHDLSILAVMVQQIEVIREQIEQPILLPLPVITSVAKPGQRSHRIVIYRPLPPGQQIFQFVSFVSKRLSDIPSSIAKALTDVDRKLVIELTDYPGLLHYSSLELPDDIWYNLVVFAHSAAKDDILHLKTHQFAAYALAPFSYQWIRLHYGTIAGERFAASLALYKTKHYVFHAPTQQPTISLQTYEPPLTLRQG